MPPNAVVDREPGAAGSGAIGTQTDPGWSGARRLLRGPLRTLVGGQCLGQAADGLAQIAFAQFIVFEAGKGASPARVASLLAVTLLPFSVVGPFAGVVIDRWPRRRVLVVVSVLRAVLTAVAAVTVAAASEAGAFLDVLLLLSLSRFGLAAKGAALPRTVRKHELVTANATSSIAGMSAAFLGAVGGAVFVGWSAAAGFVAAAALYVAAGVVFRRLPDVGGGGEAETWAKLRRAAVDVADGLRVVVRTSDIRRPLGAVSAHRLLLGAGFVILVLEADSRFHLHIAGYGLALAVTGVAVFVGSAAAPVCARRWEPASLMPVTFVPPAAAAYVGGVAPSLPVLVGGLAVTAFSFQLLKVLVDAEVGGATPDRVRGRVFSVYDVLYNVAFVAAGLLMVPLWDGAQVTALLWILGAAFVVGWLVFARVTREFPFAAHVGPRRSLHIQTTNARWSWRLASLVAGGLPVLAFPAPAWSWFAWVALVPLLLLIRSASTAREGSVRGWFGGVGFVVATEYWLFPVAGPALVLLAAGLGALWLPWGWAVHHTLGGRTSARRALSALVVLPAGWIAIEAVRSWQSLGGPWALLGASQWNQPDLLASAALGGVWLTSFLVLLVNVAVVAALIVPRKTQRVVVALVAAAAVAVGPVWAAVRPSLPVIRQLRVAVVQPGVMSGPASRLAREVAITEALARARPDLVVWSESSVGYDLGRHPEVARTLQQLAAATGADVLVNVDARRGGAGIYKSSVLVTPSGVAGSYDKTRLVPFGEYIPLRRVLSWITAFSKAAKENRHRGHGPVLLHAGEVAVGPLICFESTFPDMARREVALGAQLIVYQTASTTFQGTWAQSQHAAIAAVRAVETGRPVVHAALTGVTAAYDATGHRLAWMGESRRGGVVVTVALTRGRTPYDIAGDWMLAVCASILAGALVAASLRSVTSSALSSVESVVARRATGRGEVPA